MLAGLVEHRLRVVDADHLGDAELLRGKRGEFARTAAEIDGAPDAVGLDQGQQIVERLGPLGSESTVLLGIPVSHDLYCTCIYKRCVKLSPGEDHRGGS